MQASASTANQTEADPHGISERLDHADGLPLLQRCPFFSVEPLRKIKAQWSPKSECSFNPQFQGDPHFHHGMKFSPNYPVTKEIKIGAPLWRCPPSLAILLSFQLSKPTFAALLPPALLSVCYLSLWLQGTSFWKSRPFNFTEDLLRVKEIM